MKELVGRSVGDSSVSVVDGLKGFPEALTSAYPGGVAPTCAQDLIPYSIPRAEGGAKGADQGARPMNIAVSAGAAI